MWGNSLGWGISAVLVVVTFGSLFALGKMLNSISDPTDFSQKSGAADVLALPSLPDSALGEDAGPTDPMSLYREAIAAYQDNRLLYDQFADHPSRATIANVQPGVDLLVQASGNLQVGLFLSSPSDVINYQMSKGPLQALNSLGRCAMNDALFTKLKDKETAKKYDMAALTLGSRMYREHLCYLELTDGFGLATAAAIELAKFAEDDKDQPHADQLNNFATAVTDYSTTKLVPVQKVISSISQNDLEQHAGDIFWLAKNSKERMWRVESVLKLGRYKYNAGRPGDNRGAVRVVTEMADTESDPVVKAAAVAARDLTSDQYLMLQ